MPFSVISEVIDQGRKEVTVHPGKYVLGDPCYTFPADSWPDLLVSCDLFRGSPVGTAAGLEVAAFQTACCDGIYTDNYGNTYPVDARLIGLVPVYEGIPLKPGAGLRVEFTAPGRCSTDGMGRMKFGSYEINTDDPDDLALRCPRRLTW